MPDPISAKEVADMFVKATERIDFYWNFGLVFLTALIGWLISLKKPLTGLMKVLVSIVYIIAALMNILGLYESYTFAEALRVDLLRVASDYPQFLPNTRAALDARSFLPQRAIAIAIHVVVGAGVLVVVWFARFGESVAARSNGD